MKGYRSRGVSRSARPARPMDWEFVQAAQVLPSSSIAGVWVVLPSRIRNTYTDPTLMASRWFLGMRASVATGSAGFAGFGLIAWDATTDAIPSPLPDPIQDGELDWINRAIAPLVGVPAETSIDWNLDNVHLSKAKRRLGANKGILLVFSTVASSGSIRFGADVRCLIKE